MVYIIIPSAKHSFRGVCCFQPVRDSEILSFHDHFLKVLLGNFITSCPILIKFHLTLTIRHCMCFRKIGTEGTVLQELCHFVILTAICLP